jgi:hypothetical protein
VAATVRDVVQGAYARLALLPLGQNLDPDRAAAGLAALNDLVTSWQAHGVETGIAAGLDLNDMFPLGAQHIQGVKAMLAVQLASQSGMEPPGQVQVDARKAWAALLSRYVTPPDAASDAGLTRMPSQRYRSL